MKLILLTSRAKQSREFPTSAGSVEITEGDNWLSEEAVTFLKENSPVFQHFYDNKTYELRDQEREESPKEKEIREGKVAQLLKKAQSILPGKKTPPGANSAQVGLPADLTMSTEELKEALAKELTGKKNEEVESFQEKVESLKTHAQEGLQAAETHFKEKSLPQVESELDNLAKKSLEGFIKKMDELFDARLEKFDADLKEKLKAAQIAFEQTLKDLAEKAAAGDDTPSSAKAKSKKNKLSG